MNIPEVLANSWRRPFAASEARAADRRALVHAEQVRASYRSIPESCIGSALGGIIVAISMYRQVEAGALVAWYVSL